MSNSTEEAMNEAMNNQIDSQKMDIYPNMSNSTQNDWEKKLSSLIDDTIENRHDYKGPLVVEDDILFERLNENLKPFVITLLADARREVIAETIKKIEGMKTMTPFEVKESDMPYHIGVRNKAIDDVLATLRKEGGKWD